MSSLCLLQSEKGRTFTETGLVVLRENSRMLERVAGRKNVTDPREIEYSRVYEHELVHFRQALTCTCVYDHALEYFGACMDALASSQHVPAERGDRFNALHLEMRGRRSSPGQSVEIHDRSEGVLIIPVGREQTISPADIVEGMAVLGSFQMSTPGASGSGFLEYMSRVHPGDSLPEYWNTFELMANAVGPDTAFQVLCPLSFAALQTSQPARAFANLLAKAEQNPAGLAERCRDIRRLFEFAEIDIDKNFLFHLDHLPDRLRHPSLYPCALHAVQHIGAEWLLQYAADPLAFRDAPPEHREALRPPVVLMPSHQAGKVARLPGGRARDDLNFALAVIHMTALIGAAERLFFPAEEPWQFCLHEDCPHYESALCFQYFTPPSAETGYQHCQFPDSFRDATGMAPDEAWKARGLQRKSAGEIVAAFQATREAGLLALARKEKPSIVAWLGEEGYADLEWKCEVVLQKVARALRTQKPNDLVQARMACQIVVHEIAGKLK